MFSRCCGREKRKLLQAVGFLQLLGAPQPLTHLDTGTRNPRCLCKLVLSPLTLCPSLNRELYGEGKGIVWDAHRHTNAHTSYTVLTQISHTQTWVTCCSLLPLYPQEAPP